jgi:hypothetical protein
MHACCQWAPVQQHPQLLMAGSEGQCGTINSSPGKRARARAGACGLRSRHQHRGRRRHGRVSASYIVFTGDSPDFLENARVVYGKANHSWTHAMPTVICTSIARRGLGWWKWSRSSSVWRELRVVGKE